MTLRKNSFKKSKLGNSLSNYLNYNKHIVPSEISLSEVEVSLVLKRVTVFVELWSVVFLSGCLFLFRRVRVVTAPGRQGLAVAPGTAQLVWTAAEHRVFIRWRPEARRCRPLLWAVEESTAAASPLALAQRDFSTKEFRYLQLFQHASNSLLISSLDKLIALKLTWL